MDWIFIPAYLLCTTFRDRHVQILQPVPFVVPERAPADPREHLQQRADGVQPRHGRDGRRPAQHDDDQRQARAGGVHKPFHWQMARRHGHARKHAARTRLRLVARVLPQLQRLLHAAARVVPRGVPQESVRRPVGHGPPRADAQRHRPAGRLRGRPVHGAGARHRRRARPGHAAVPVLRAAHVVRGGAQHARGAAGLLREVRVHRQRGPAQEPRHDQLHGRYRGQPDGQAAGAGPLGRHAVRLGVGQRRRRALGRRGQLVPAQRPVKILQIASHMGWILIRVHVLLCNISS